MAESRTSSQVCELAAQYLSNARRDLPFTLIYMLDADGKSLTKAAQTGFTGAHRAAPASAPVDDAGETVWPFRAVIESGDAVLVEDLLSRFTAIPKGEWNHEPESATLLPIAQQGQPRPSGVFVAGLNPYREFDDEYRGFVSLLADQIGVPSPMPLPTRPSVGVPRSWQNWTVPRQSSSATSATNSERPLR